MKFCSECFRYEEIIDIIESNENLGDCDIQNSHKNVYICDTETDIQVLDQVKNVLLEVVDLYTANSSLPSKFPDKLKLNLWEALEQKWSIFTLNSIDIKSILCSFFQDDTDFNSKMFKEKVGILQENNNYDSYLIVQNNDWKSFVDSLKFSNRFHTDHLRLDILKKFILNATRTIKPSDYTFYRSRISNDEVLKKEKMSAPPIGKSSSGRLNAQGISLLYLCTNYPTSIKEVRASFDDRVYIGKFKINETISIVDLTRFEESSLNSENLLSYYFNRSTLQKMVQELSKPTNNNSSAINYIPTQYISDYIKSLVEENEKGKKTSLDGILYDSTMDAEGLNLALFDPDIAECESIEEKRISEINYNLV